MLDFYTILRRHHHDQHVEIRSAVTIFAGWVITFSIGNDWHMAYVDAASRVVRSVECI